jgi:hypothetical protein
MRTCSRSRRAGRRSGTSTRSVEQRAKRDAERQAERARYRGRARYWPSRAKGPKQMSLGLGVCSESDTARRVERGTERTTRPKPSRRKMGSGTRASTAAGRASSSTTGQINTGSVARSCPWASSMLSEGLRFRRGAGKLLDRASRS